MFGRKRKKHAGRKFNRIMEEFEKGKLRTRGGKIVKNPQQAVGIAYSEQVRSNKNKI